MNSSLQRYFLTYLGLLSRLRLQIHIAHFHVDARIFEHILNKMFYLHFREFKQIKILVLITTIENDKRFRVLYLYTFYLTLNFFFRKDENLKVDR